MSRSRRPSGLSRGPGLLLLDGSGLHWVPLSEQSPTVIGRGAPSTVISESRRLSRRHAAFSLRDGQIFVEDLGSTNGTLVGGKRIKGPTTIAAADIVQLGSALVGVRWSEPSIRSATHLDGLEELAHDELERVRTFNRPAALVVFQDPVLGAPTGWMLRIVESLRSVDRAAIAGTNSLAVLLPEANSGQAALAAQELLSKARAILTIGITSARPNLTAPEWFRATRGAAAAAEPGQLVQSGAAEPEPSTGPIVLDPIMIRLHETIDRVAASAISILVLGETGTGKEVIARAIHDRSHRASEAIHTLNCGAIPPTLLESVLFGHEKGAFTGADSQRMGLFEEANGGTVFLDEIGELSLPAQVALLRVLETRRIRRVGSKEEQPIDVRVIAATHQDLEAMCEAGSFRSDLLYRLNSITLEVPPLRERPQEVEPLAGRFLAESRKLNRRDVRTISPGAMAALKAWPWPGNVRELRNAIDRAVVMARDTTIELDDLPKSMTLASHAPTVTPSFAPRAEVAHPPIGDLKEELRSYERELICAAMERADGNQTQAARLLSMPRRTLVYKLRDIDLLAPFRPRDLGPFKELLAQRERTLISRALHASGGDRPAAARSLGIQLRTLHSKIDG